MSEKIIYEPHPVSPERKQELREQGYKIIDAQFDPKATDKPAK
jgi:4-hydroxy-3-methylbut-2-enyl diphosphate reductase IspH